MVTKLNCPPSDITAFLSDVSSVLKAQNLDELADKFLQFLLEISPKLSRGVIFMADNNGQINPIATRVQPMAPTRFSINKKILKSVMTSRTPASHVLTVEEQHRRTGIIGLPIGSAHGPGVLYLEADGLAIADLDSIIGLAVQMIAIVGPKVESYQLQHKINMLISNALKTLNAVIEAKDTYTSGHSQRVATYSQAIAEAMGLSTKEKDDLLISAVCHDIGKVGVPDLILKKPGLLSVEEFNEMKAHPVIGASIVEGSEHYHEIVGGIKHHHERFDGTGYPDQLIGEAIPLFGRIIAIADAFDAMTSGRSYSGYMSTDEAAIDLAQKTDLFDPEILRSFVKAQERGRISLRTGTRVSSKSA